MNHDKNTSTKSQAAHAEANPMWGGHYALGPAEAFAAINPSIAIDKRLWQQDIAASIAHATMLQSCGILTSQETSQIIDGLKNIESEIKTGQFNFTATLEDIHMNIESRLREIIGAVAGKLHTARSRNDQVATDFRLFLRDGIDALQHHIAALQIALLAQAEQHIETVLPGLTHLQPAQPISFAHHLLAYVQMLSRDASRLADCRVRLNECPLGAAALAGTSYPINREMSAAALGFARPMANSIDAVSDRDFALEFLSALSILSIHLSRLSEELIYWMNPMIGFISLPETFTSGSSIMPQKRNPDAAELIRGKSGNAIGALMQTLAMMKSLPLAYNKDTQEDKAPAIRALDDMLLCLPAMEGMIAGLTAHKEKMLSACDIGFITATDLADFLVQECHLAFRDAHHITGRIVKFAEQNHMKLDALSLEQMRAIFPQMPETIYSVLTPVAALNRRSSFGGTAPMQVRAAIATARKKVSS